MKHVGTRLVMIVVGSSVVFAIGVAALAGPQPAANPRSPWEAATRPAAAPVPRQVAPLRAYTAFSWAAAPAEAHHIVPMLIFDPARPAEVGFAARGVPQGCRAMRFQGVPKLMDNRADFCRDGLGRPTDQPGIWTDNGQAACRAWMGPWFAGYKDAGGTVDILVLDFEAGWSSWQLKAPDFAAIIADPRFPAVAADLGIADMNLAMKHGPGGESLRWDDYMQARLDQAVNRSLGEALWRSFPNAGMSRFTDFLMTPPNVVPELNGIGSFFQGPICGTYQSPAASGVVGGLPRLLPLVAKPYNCMLWQCDRIRASVRSSPIPVISWINYRSYRGDDPRHPNVPLGGTDYWDEMAYHVLLSTGQTNLLFFNPHDANGGATAADAHALEAVLANTETQAHGHALAAPLMTEPLKNDAPYIVSAAKTDDGHIVARVTFSPEVHSAKVTIEGRQYDVSVTPPNVGAWVDVR